MTTSRSAPSSQIYVSLLNVINKQRVATCSLETCLPLCHKLRQFNNLSLRTNRKLLWNRTWTAHKRTYPRTKRANFSTTIKWATKTYLLTSYFWRIIRATRTEGMRTPVRVHCGLCNPLWRTTSLTCHRLATTIIISSTAWAQPRCSQSIWRQRVAICFWDKITTTLRMCVVRRLTHPRTLKVRKLRRLWGPLSPQT